MLLYCNNNLILGGTFEKSNISKKEQYHQKNKCLIQENDRQKKKEMQDTPLYSNMDNDNMEIEEISMDTDNMEIEEIPLDSKTFPNIDEIEKKYFEGANLLKQIDGGFNRVLIYEKDGKKIAWRMSADYIDDNKIDTMSIQRSKLTFDNYKMASELHLTPKIVFYWFCNCISCQRI